MHEQVYFLVAKGIKPEEKKKNTYLELFSEIRLHCDPRGLKLPHVQRAREDSVQPNNTTTSNSNSNSKTPTKRERKRKRERARHSQLIFVCRLSGTFQVCEPLDQFISVIQTHFLFSMVICITLDRFVSDVYVGLGAGFYIPRCSLVKTYLCFELGR